jgi:hypothetical protein
MRMLSEIHATAIQPEMLPRVQYVLFYGVKTLFGIESIYGIYHIAEYSLLLGVKLKDVPSDIGTRQQVLAKHGLPARG